MKSLSFEFGRSHSSTFIGFVIFLTFQFHLAIILVSGEEVNGHGSSLSFNSTIQTYSVTSSNDTIDGVSKSELSDLQSSVAPPSPVFEDDDMHQWMGKEWIYRKELKGYLIVSNDLRFLTKLLNKRKILKVRIPLSSARITELIIHRRDVEIKASTWNKVSRVIIRVPFGFTPQELRVIERPTNIDIYAPYSFIEFPGEASETPKKNYKPKDKR